MRAVGVVLVGLLTGCSPKSAEVVDGSPPDASCDTDVGFTPITVTGSSPAGPLDVFHYAHAGSFGGFCVEQYAITLSPHQSVGCNADPSLLLSIFDPTDPSAIHAAFADYTSQHPAMTDQVTFEATTLDPPSAPAPHIVGHFVSSDPAWSFEFQIDLTSQFTEGCV